MGGTNEGAKRPVTRRSHLLEVSLKHDWPDDGSDRMARDGPHACVGRLARRPRRRAA